MATLTKEEKDALEDVFLSIHTNQNSYKKLKELSSLVIASQISIVASKVLKRAKFGLKKVKTSYFSSFFDKTKKSLSK